MARIILASSSPRRRELLKALGWRFDVRHPDVDESRRKGEPPRAYVRRVARDKAQAVASGAPRAIVIAADTAVVLGSRVLGKPRSEAEARRMLARLAGRWHEVVTGTCVIEPGKPPRACVTQSRVLFTPISPREIERYVATGEPMDKAGAYALQGRGAMFVRAVSGSVTNVIGLPLAELCELLDGRGAGARPSARVG